MFRLAQIISFIANPLFLALPIPFFLVYYETNDFIAAFKWMIFSMFFIVMVGAFVIVEVRSRVFSDLDVSRREQRPLLFLFAGFVAIMYLLGLIILKAPTILFLAVGGFIASILLISFVNRYVKASIHVAASTIFLLVLFILYGGLNIVWLLFLPVIAWARVKAKKHTIQEVVAGAILGIVLPLSILSIFKLALILA
jgi:membrane-associated phospholipid phosphatase